MEWMKLRYAKPSTNVGRERKFDGAASRGLAALGCRTLARLEDENPALAGLSKVERAGIEPATSGLKSRRSPS